VRTIRKYTIPADGKPHDYELSCVPIAVANGTLRDEVDFWEDHDDSEETWTVRLQVVTTGEELPGVALWLGTTPERYGTVRHLVQIPVEGGN